MSNDKYLSDCSSYTNITDDLLDEDSDMIPRAQQWQVIASIPNNPNHMELKAWFDLWTFMNHDRKSDKSYLKLFLSNDKYTIDDLKRVLVLFRNKNANILRKKFNAKYPKYSGGCNGLIKPWGSFATKKLAKKRIDEIMERKETYYDLNIYQNGMWSEPNPDPIMLSSDKIIDRENDMQAYMKGHRENHIKNIGEFKRRQKILHLRSQIKNKQETNTEIKDEDLCDFTLDELEFEYSKYDPVREDSISIKDEDQIKQQRGEVKNLLESEIREGRGNLITPEAIKQFNIDQKLIDDHTNNKSNE